MSQRVDNYYTDCRVMIPGSVFERIYERSMTAALRIDDGVLIVPIKFIVCPTCRGKGSHVNPSIDCNGLSSEDFAADPDFAEDYYSGRYDQPCNECRGRRVVVALDEDAADKETIKEYHRQIRSEIEYAQLCAAERRMGC